MIFKRHLKQVLILAAVFSAAPFFCAAIFLKRMKNKDKPPKRVLIIDNAKIGDLICATPVFRAIREKYPDVYLAALVIPRVEEILRNNKNINELIVAPLNSGLGFKETPALIKKIKSGNYDASVSLVPGTLNFVLPFFAGIPERVASINERMGFFYRVLACLANKKLSYKKNELSIRHYLDLLKFLGIENNNLAKEVFVDAYSEKKAEDFLARLGVAPSDIVVGICLGAGNKIKEWGEANFAKLADEIIRRYNFKIIAIGGPQDELLLKKFERLAENDVIITYRDFSLKELPALIKKFNYFISVDTGPLFIANALGVPAIDIVGPFNYVEQAPYYDKNCEIVKPENLACWPCLHIHSSGVLKCRYGHYQCLKETTSEKVLSAFEALKNRLNL